MKAPHQRSYRFGRFRLDTTARVLLRGSRVVAVPPRALDVLGVLLRRRGTVIPIEELAAQAWGGSKADARGLARCVSELRRALSSSSSLIETVPRRGYRFLAERRRRSRRAVTVGGATAQQGRTEPPLVDAVDLVLGWCNACDRHVWIATPKEAAAALGTTIRAVYRAIENGESHYRETTAGDISVCMPSLIENLTAFHHSGR